MDSQCRLAMKRWAEGSLRWQSTWRPIHVVLERAGMVPVELGELACNQGLAATESMASLHDSGAQPLASTHLGKISCSPILGLTRVIPDHGGVWMMCYIRWQESTWGGQQTWWWMIYFGHDGMCLVREQSVLVRYERYWWMPNRSGMTVTRLGFMQIPWEKANVTHWRHNITVPGVTYPPCLLPCNRRLWYGCLMTPRISSGAFNGYTFALHLLAVFCWRSDCCSTVAYIYILRARIDWSFLV